MSEDEKMDRLFNIAISIAYILAIAVMMLDGFVWRP